MKLADSLPALSVRRPYLAAVINLLIVIAGIAAILGVEVRELPDVDRPVVTVRGDYPGGSPETIDAEVTSVIEGAVARVNGVASVRSASEENNFRINIEFNPNVDLVDVRNRCPAQLGQHMQFQRCEPPTCLAIALQLGLAAFKGVQRNVLQEMHVALCIAP